MKTIGAIAIAILMFFGKSSGATTMDLATEEFYIPSTDHNIKLYVRNKHSKNQNKFPTDKILLYVHGATFPAEASFDTALGGKSMMDYIASHGYDVYMLDLRGYGRSDRPPEMQLAAEQNAPIVRTDTAVKDVDAAVKFVMQRRGVTRINLMGWSWGTSIMGWYTVQNPSTVGKLVLYAPMWLFEAPPASNSPPLGAYRTVTAEAFRQRWYTGVPEDKRAGLAPDGWIDTIIQAVLSSDPTSTTRNPAAVRAPNGILADNDDHWRSGKPLYDPSQITVPTIIVHAEWDADLPTYMAREYFSKLTRTPYKRYVEIGEGTHFVMMEKNRMQLFQAVQQFLDEKITVGE